MPLFSIFLLAAILIFVLGNLYRVIRVIRLPAQLRWELYPLPKGRHDRQRDGGSYFEQIDWWTKPLETGRRTQLEFMVKEVVVLRTVLENFRSLWVWSLLLHWGFYIYIAATALILGVFGVEGGDVAFTRFPSLLRAESAGYGVACALGLIGSLGLLATRTLHSRLKGYTTRTTVFNLALFVAIFATGLTVLFTPVRGYLPFWGVLLGRHSVVGMHLLSTYLHLALVGFFLVYFPFTHMTHAYMKYFTWHQVRWEDTPARFDPRANEAIALNLGRSVSWQAPHIRGTNSQTWLEIAAGRKGLEGSGHD